VAVFSNLLHNSGVDSIALLEGLLGGGPLANKAGDEGRGIGFLGGLADAVKDVSTGDGASGDVQAALLGGYAIVSWWSGMRHFLRTRWLRSAGERAYAEAFVHGLVGGMRAPAALGVQQLPRRGSRSSGKHCGCNW
jgi:hypothetical protein